ncbi:MAG: ferrous iron transport protein B [Dictyoglomus sp. NZ13-RE01]|nr:MAG: ferrous iron transport protein B [Dictyoglomus sp. NZ13-RE01]
MISDLKKQKVIKVALVGNPNSGKSTIFNALTHGHAHVGNWPGVTVEKKEGKLRYKDYEFIVVDLPGTYSLTPYSIDERIARNYILKEKPDVVVCIADSTNLERNLYLLISLLETGANVVLDLNMADLLKEKGIEIDKDILEKTLGIPVVFTVGTKEEGIPELKEAIIEAKERGFSQFKIDYGKDIEEVLSRLEAKISLTNLPYTPRFLAIKLLEEDMEIIEELRKMGYGSLVEEILHEVVDLEKKLGYDLKTKIIERRYSFLKELVKACTKQIASKEEKLTLSDKIDRIVLNRFLGIPIFALIMWITFQLTFTVGGFFAGYIETFFEWLQSLSSTYLQSIGAPTWLSSLLSDGVINGVGSVLVFLPNIMVMFLFLSFLEDVGYMARAAFVMDKIMYAIGLPGRSFIPMILGFGCNVPAIMSTRTIPSERDRLLTILINPFMSCTARLPVYIMFTSIFFKSNQGLVVFSLYLLGILVAVFSAKLFKSTIPSLKGPVSPLVMELPPYRLPTLKGVLIHMWERSSQFLKKAGTIIFAGVVVLWFLASFPFGAEYGSASTLAGKIGKFIAPIFKPAGFPYWQVGVALLFGIIAKEVVVGTFGTLFGGEENFDKVLPQYFTPLSAYAFMVMSLLYIPCIASIGVIYKETGSFKWTAFATIYSLLIGWLLSVLVFQIGRIFI